MKKGDLRMNFEFKKKRFVASLVFGFIALLHFLIYSYFVYIAYSAVFNSTGLDAVGRFIVGISLMVYSGVAFFVFEILSLLFSVFARRGADGRYLVACTVNLVLSIVLMLLALCSFIGLFLL